MVQVASVAHARACGDESMDRLDIRDALHGFVTGAGALILREVTEQESDVSGG